MNAEKGFTLLEIMVALAVFATLSAAIMSASSYVLGQSARVESRLFAAWLADNHLSDLQLRPQPLAEGQTVLNLTFAHRDWRVQQRLAREPGTGLWRVELEVSPAGSAQVMQSRVHWLAVHHAP
jgi:general secretion pathway protein I